MSVSLIRKLVLYLALFVVLLLLIVMPVRYFSSHTTITLEPSDAVSITVGTVDDNGSIGARLKNASSRTSWRTKKGNYAVLFHGKDIQDRVTIYHIDSPTTIKVPVNLWLSADKLKSLASQQAGAIQQALASQTNMDGYQITYLKLYLHGSWAGVEITPSDTSADTMKLVLSKSGGAWHISDGPKIVLSFSDSPDIPKAVITSVNNSL